MIVHLFALSMRLRKKQLATGKGDLLIFLAARTFSEFYFASRLTVHGRIESVHTPFSAPVDARICGCTTLAKLAQSVR